MLDKNEHMKPSLSARMSDVCDERWHISQSQTLFFTSIIFEGGCTTMQSCSGHPFGQQWPALGRCLNMAFSSTWRCLCLVCSLLLYFHLLWHLIYFEHLFHLIILELCDTSTYVRPEQLGSGDCYSNGPQVESKCVGQIRSVLWDRGCG